MRISCETCPHYLTFDQDQIADGATSFKCAPPIRSAGDRDGLWRGLADGAIDLVATDHSPAPPALKHLDDGNFLRAWGGIASLQLGLAAVWTGASARGLPFESLARWMAAAPARLAGLARTKGAIAVGQDADLVIWDPEAAGIVDPATLHHRHPVDTVCRHASARAACGRRSCEDASCSTRACCSSIRRAGPFSGATTHEPFVTKQDSAG